MTTPYERTRALIWAGGFLIELARDQSLPIDVRRRAVGIARHFPTVGEVTLAAGLAENGMTSGLELAKPASDEGWEADFSQGLLSSSTRLDWPES